MYFVRNGRTTSATTITAGDVLIVAPRTKRYWVRRPGVGALFVMTEAGDFDHVSAFDTNTTRDPMEQIRHQYGPLAIGATLVRWEEVHDAVGWRSVVLGRRKFLAIAL